MDFRAGKRRCPFHDPTNTCRGEGAIDTTIDLSKGCFHESNVLKKSACNLHDAFRGYLASIVL